MLFALYYNLSEHRTLHWQSQTDRIGIEEHACRRRNERSKHHDELTGNKDKGLSPTLKGLCERSSTEIE